MENRFIPGDIISHFKRELLSEEEKASSKYLYRYLGTVTHSETKEELALYEALYGDFKIYVRPLDMFLSKVDNQKYPNIRSTYRFEKLK